MEEKFLKDLEIQISSLLKGKMAKNFKNYPNPNIDLDLVEQGFINNLCHQRPYVGLCCYLIMLAKDRNAMDIIPIADKIFCNESSDFIDFNRTLEEIPTEEIDKIIKKIDTLR